jgi:hypothetical protein
MLDKPEKTRELIDILDAAVPFEVALMPDLIEHLARQQNPVAIKSVETVSKVSYLGNSVGANVFRVTPESGRCDATWACLKSAKRRR